MTNEKLKKKICDIIAPYVSAWGDDERIADALIAAGLTFEPIIIRTVELPDECEKKIRDILKEEEAIIEEVTHRAEVAERELERYTVLIKPLENDSARLNHLAARVKRALKDL